MPRTINGESRRQSVCVPVPMIEEINRIVREHPELRVPCAHTQNTQDKKAINYPYSFITNNLTVSL